MNAPLRGLIRGLVISLVLAAATGAWIYINRPAVEQELVVHSTGKALIGGPFTLTGHLGESVSDHDFRGKLMIVYFGYTFCPDVCPLDMRRLSMGLQLLEDGGQDLGRLQALFITIDPARDTPQVLATFVGHFHPRLIGLTGTAGQIAVAARAYRAFYERAGGGEGEDYLMNHSNNIYIMDANGEFLGFFSSLDTPEVIAGRLAGYLKDLPVADK